jgi:hypothetical protein
VAKVTGKECTKMHWYADAKDAAFWIFPLRNYKECILRHAQHGGIVRDKLDAYFREQTSGTPWPSEMNTDYIDLLSCFDRHEGPKRLIRYEDVIKSPREILTPLLIGDLGLDADWFMDDIDKHVSESVSAYHGGSATRGKKALFHSLGIPQDTKRRWDDRIKRDFPALFEKYLSQYGEPE